MVEITYDADLCERCGSCVMACPVAIPRQEEKGAIPKVDEADLQNCIRCGHCVAICPQGALSHSHFPEGTVNPIRFEHVPTYDQALELIRSRRSRRAYKDRVVERELIEKVLDAARCGPSAHNDQSTEFVVVQDKKILDDISALSAKALTKTAMPFRHAIGRMMMRLILGRRGAAHLGELAPAFEAIVDLYLSGTDRILCESPVLILFCADSVSGTVASINANIAMHNAALSAETLGLAASMWGLILILK